MLVWGAGALFRRYMFFRFFFCLEPIHVSLSVPWLASHAVILKRRRISWWETGTSFFQLLVTAVDGGEALEVLPGELTHESNLSGRSGRQGCACAIWRIVVLLTDWGNPGRGSIKPNLGHIKQWFSLFKTQIHQYLSSARQLSREEGMAARVSQLYFFWILPSLWGFLTVAPVVATEPGFQGSPRLFFWPENGWKGPFLYCPFTTLWKGPCFPQNIY